MKRIYGGIFGDSPFYGEGGMRTPQGMLLATGRCSLQILIENLGARRVWLPSYLCKTMLTKAVGEVDLRIYDVDRFLEIPGIRALDQVRSGDLFVLINYFGFPAGASLTNYVRDQGAWILEDSSMGFFTNRNPMSHFVLRSLTKNFGFGDGAILSNYSPCSLAASFDTPPRDWSTVSWGARLGRRHYDEGAIDDKSWLKESLLARRMCPEQPFWASFSAKAKFRTMGDGCYDSMRDRQRENYAILSNEFSPICVIPFSNSVHSGGFFPIRVKNRDKVQKKLFAKNVFPAVHWKLPWEENRFPESQNLSRLILSIPCDWRYDEDDMRYMIRSIKEALHE